MERNNLNQAHLRAKKKRIDNTTVDELLPYHLRENKTELIASLHDDNYKNNSSQMGENSESQWWSKKTWNINGSGLNPYAYL